MRRLAASLAIGAAPTLVITVVSAAAPVQLASFDNPFSLDAIYGSWGAPFATLTSDPDRFIVRSHEYGSGYKYLGGEFNANGNDTVQLLVTVSEGTAGCLVDLVDANNNGIAFRFYGLTPGNGNNGTNDYTLRMRLSDGIYFTGTGVLDTTRISQMHIEVDPGPTHDYYTASFNDLSLITSVVSTAWTGAGGNAWSASGNWSNGVPNGIDAAASFGSIASGQFNVNVDGGNKTVGAITLDNSTSYTLGGSSALEVLAARSALLDAQRQLADALASANTARADLDRALGAPLPTLGANNR